MSFVSIGWLNFSLMINCVGDAVYHAEPDRYDVRRVRDVGDILAKYVRYRL